ncbi:MAG: hypothetical protein ABIH40_04425 [Candidatus Omnitrophota bacterium]
MRRIVFTVLILCFLISYVSESEAFWGKKKKAEEPAKVEEVKPEVKKAKPPAEEKKEAERKVEVVPATADAKRALLEKKQKLLNNTEWEIELSPLSGKGKKESDTLTFSNNQVSSKDLIRRGFSASNYTLSMQDDGNVVWETMQSSEKAGIAFWRGEIDPNVERMQGILSHRIDDKTTRDNTFVSVGKKAIEAAGNK